MWIILFANKFKQMKNMAQVVGTDNYLSTLNRGIIAAGLVEQLNGDGPFTIFAPSDVAFGKLSKDFFDNLEKPENKADLADLLNHHIIAGKINFSELKNGQKLNTVNGKELNVTVKNRRVSINGASVLAKDIEGSNGVLHSLDKVIILS